MSDRLTTLRAKLTDLVAELRGVQDLDSATRDQLEQAATEIISALQRSATKAGPSDGSLRDRLVELEASHPNVAAVVNRLIDMLAQMGI